HLCAIHEPDRHIAAGVAPQNVALAVAVEVVGGGDRSCHERMWISIGSIMNRPRVGSRTAVQGPLRPLIGCKVANAAARFQCIGGADCRSVCECAEPHSNGPIEWDGG